MTTAPFVLLSQSQYTLIRAVLMPTGSVKLQQFSLGGSREILLDAQELRTLLGALPAEVLREAFKDHNPVYALYAPPCPQTTTLLARLHGQEDA
jgi:hypothetical protein